jgi:hypothetical protein
VILVRKRAHSTGHRNTLRFCGWPLGLYSRLISRDGQCFCRIAVFPAPFVLDQCKNYPLDAPGSRFASAQILDTVFRWDDDTPQSLVWAPSWTSWSGCGALASTTVATMALVCGRRVSASRFQRKSLLLCENVVFVPVSCRWLHRCVAYYLFNTWLVHGELRQMFFGGSMSRRHLCKLLLHPLKDTSRGR